MIDVGSAAPSFELACEDGRLIRSEDLLGKPYVLFFYPKDNTPGCTQEACDFRDSYEALLGQGVAVFGISKDSVKSHMGFKTKHNLPFPLLSDPEKVLHQAYGAWGKKMMYGKEVEGTIRSTFLIGSDGLVKRVWPKVSVKGHVSDVLSAVNAF